MRSREFYPADSVPQAVVILPNHLGSSFESDFSDRGEQLANDLGMLVVAYERPGTAGPRTFNLSLRHELEPSRYIQTAAQTGQELEAKLDAYIGVKGLQRILTGNSAAALEAIMVARSQTLQANYLVAADPVAMQQMGNHEFGRQWVKHQRQDNKRKAADSTPEKETRPDNPSATTAKTRMAGRFSRDVAIYLSAWGSDIAYTSLRDIAESDDFFSLATYVALVEHSFTGTPEYSRGVAEELSGKRSMTAATPFKAEFLPDTFHSYFNDPKNYSNFIHHALIQIEPAPDLGYIA